MPVSGVGVLICVKEIYCNLPKTARLYLRALAGELVTERIGILGNITRLKVLGNEGLGALVLFVIVLFIKDGGVFRCSSERF